MEDLVVRQFEDRDRLAVINLFNDFIDYMASIDPLKRTVRKADYGEKYIEKTLKEINEKNGLFVVAEIENVIVGLGVATIGRLSEEDLLETLPQTPGRITELYVDSKYRGQGIGTKLMAELEIYLKQKGCDTVHVEVFAPNQLTHKLYEKLGYIDRNIDMVKDA